MLKAILNTINGCIWIIGLAGIPGDVETWAKWINPYMELINSPLFRLALIILGLVFFYLINLEHVSFFSGIQRLKNRYSSFRQKTELRSEIQSGATPIARNVQISDDLAEVGGDQIEITAKVNNNEIAGEFFNNTGGYLKCSVWITDLREWDAQCGYLNKKQKLAPCCLVRSRTIDPKRRYDIHTALITRDRDRGRRLCVRGHVEGLHDREQHFDAPYPENIWTLTVEVKIESETIAKKDISFKCPADKGFELTANPEPKQPD